MKRYRTAGFALALWFLALYGPSAAGLEVDLTYSTGGEDGQTGVLYVSPLKALNNDIQRNLLVPLDELKKRFSKETLVLF